MTPAGVELTQEEADEQERIVCPICQLAVIEDEWLPCPDCGEGRCLYCYEAELHTCKTEQP